MLELRKSRRRVPYPSFNLPCLNEQNLVRALRSSRASCPRVQHWLDLEIVV